MRGGLVFGKLPRHGDFVGRGLSDAARSAWDAWISAGLGMARARLGESFEAAHDAAAPWRFVCEGRGYGEGWMVGALAPSLDGAGRRFVVVLGVQGLSGPEAAAIGAELSSRLEEGLYRCLSEGLDADGALALADQALAGIEPVTAEALSGLARADGGVWWTLGGGGAQPAVIHAPAPPAEVFARAFAEGIAA